MTRPQWPLIADGSPRALARTTAWNGSITARASSAVNGSIPEMSLPRRSQPEKSAPRSDEPARSTPRNEAPAHLAPARSASRMRTSLNAARDRSAPWRPVNDQSPPSTFNRSYVQESNWLPTSLHPLNSASKKPHLTNVQFRNAVSVWLDALNRTPRNVQSVKAAPTPPASVMSTSTNRTLAWFSLVRSRESQFADEMVVSVGAAGRPCTGSAMRPSMAYGTSAAH